MPYRHTQRGIWITIVCLVFAAFDAAVAWRSAEWLPALVLIVLVAVAIVFSSLTVEVDGDELRWHFGPGLWTYRIKTRLLDLIGSGEPLTVSAERRSYKIPPVAVSGWRVPFKACGG